MSYQDQEECDEQGHSSGNDFRFDQIGDPRDDDEHEARQVDLHQHLHRLAFDLHLKKMEINYTLFYHFVKRILVSANNGIDCVYFLTPFPP